MADVFAHAGEMHETITEAATHNLLTAWYIALPLFVIFMFGVASMAYLISNKSKTIAMHVVLATLFIAGVGLHKVSPMISVLSLSGGFGLALVQVIFGLSNPPGHNRR